MERKINVLLLTLLIVLFQTAKQLNSEIIDRADTQNEVHSRKKRFLIFPEGSSLQLVYCLTIPSIGMGNIFTIGWTAALAWELPHEPIHPFKKNEESLQRIDKTSSGGWTTKKGLISTSDKSKKKTYYDFSSINYASQPYATIKDYLMKPGYTKIGYTSNTDSSYRDDFKGKYVDYRPIYDASAFNPSRKSNNVKEEAASFYSHPVYKAVHRRTRRDLFVKIEKFLDAQRQDGKACLLKAICEVSKKSYNEVGTFMEEIIKAIFKIKRYKNDYDYDEYDLAADENHNCSETYSRCSSSVWSLL